MKVLEKWRNKDGTIENGFAVRLRREIATYEAMSGSLNVCHFHGAFECEKHLYLVTEMCTGGCAVSCLTIKQQTASMPCSRCLSGLQSWKCDSSIGYALVSATDASARTVPLPVANAKSAL